MTRGEIWKDFFKRTVLPAVIALFLFFMFKNVFTEDGQTNYFYVWLCCGIPFGIRRMFVWLVPTVRAVFDAVRGGRKERAAHGTFLSVLGLIEFRIEQLIKRKYGNPKPLTEQGIGNELRAYASVPVVQ